VAFSALTQAILVRSKNKKPQCIRTEAFDFVDKRFEISNHDLIRDMDRIIKLQEVLTHIV
jgi:hypothetical protein